MTWKMKLYGLLTGLAILGAVAVAAGADWVF
jgi:hypothetical protein